MLGNQDLLTNKPVSKDADEGAKKNPMKQLKSSSYDLRTLFENSITVRHVFENLQSCQADDDALAIQEHMKKLDFDVLGIEDKGVIYGYVEQTKLEIGQCRKYEHVFHPSELIAESTPLIDLLLLLHDKPRVFVLDRNRVSGIVTRGDLQKAPVRMLLFGLVTLLEMHLLRLIRDYYDQDSWQEFLTEPRLKSATKLMDERRARNEAINLMDCLQFCDKSTLILRNPQIIEFIGFKSVGVGEHLLKSAEDLRNKLAHAHDLVTGSSWPAIIDLSREIETLIERCEEIENQ